MLAGKNAPLLGTKWKTSPSSAGAPHVQTQCGGCAATEFHINLRFPDCQQSMWTPPLPDQIRSRSNWFHLTTLFSVLAIFTFRLLQISLLLFSSPMQSSGPYIIQMNREQGSPTQLETGLLGNKFGKGGSFSLPLL